MYKNKRSKVKQVCDVKTSYKILIMKAVKEGQSLLERVNCFFVLELSEENKRILVSATLIEVLVK